MENRDVDRLQISPSHLFLYPPKLSFTSAYVKYLVNTGLAGYQIVLSFPAPPIQLCVMPNKLFLSDITASTSVGTM